MSRNQHSDTSSLNQVSSGVLDLPKRSGPVLVEREFEYMDHDLRKQLKNNFDRKFFNLFLNCF